MDTNIYITIFSALAGAFVGGLVAEVRNIIQLRRDVNKARNNLLYKLLDIWFIVKSRDIDNFFEAFFDRFSTKLNVPKSLIIEDFKKNTELNNTIAKMIKDRFPTEHLELKYQEAVDLLGPLDPILAYRMSGKESLIRYQDFSAMCKKYVFGSLTPEDISIDNFIGHVKEFVDKRLAREVLSLIEDDIRNVGDKIGGRTRSGIEETFRRLETRATDETNTLIDEYIDHILRFNLNARTDR